MAKNPQVILDEIVKDGEVKDVMLLRKAASSFTNITVKGYVGNRFAFVNRLKADMAKEGGAGIPGSCHTSAMEVLEKWDFTLDKFKSFSAQEDDWTVEAGVSMTSVLLNLASELDTVHTAMSQVWDSVKKARKAAVAASVKQKNSAIKEKNSAIRPFTYNGVGAGWKALLFEFNLVTTGHVITDHDTAQSEKFTPDTTTVIDWSCPHHWCGRLEQPEIKQGHR